jgi:peptidoglycan/LPS O-acetylase OafA/YrhL
LLPVYWCVLAMAVALVFMGSPLPRMGWVTPGSAAASFWGLRPPAAFWWDFWLHVMLLHGLVPQGVLPWGFVALLGPAWSLSTEWQFYAVMAAVLRKAGLAGLAYGLAALAVGYHVLAGFLPAYWVFSRAFLPDAAGYFALGLASAAWLRGEGWAALGVSFVVVTGLGFGSGEVLKGLIGVGWILALGAEMLDGMPVLPRLLGSRVARYLGAISYPLYLLNEPVQRAAAMALAPLAHGDAVLFTWLWLPPALVGPVAAAAVLHRLVERPLLRGVGGLTPWRSVPQTIPPATAP